MGSDEILVKVEGINKKYCKDLKRSLRYGLQDIAGELFLRKKPNEELRRQEFWALQDVNFELKRWEAFGIIGVNGSGKTTLLKIMQGLLKPTQGQVTIRGQVGALISLGAGFQPLLTGRENIYVNAAILRVPIRHVEKRLDDIIGFADLGDFIDAPMKTYSSGMRGRLGFAVATHLIDPDVLLLDEVLATGDWKFKDRCFRRMEEIVSSGATVIFVSHLMPKVEKFCNRALLLHKGVVKGVGTASEICQMYYDLPEIEIPPSPKERKQGLARLMRKRDRGKEASDAIALSSADHLQGSNDPTSVSSNPQDAVSQKAVASEDVLAVELLDDQGMSQTAFQTMDAMTVQIYASLQPRPPKIKVVVQFLTPGDEISVSHFPSTFVLDTEKRAAKSPESENGVDALLNTTDNDDNGPLKIECCVPEVSLRAGKYRVSVTVTPIEPGVQKRSRSRFTTTETFFIQDTKGNKAGASKPNSKQSPGLVYMPVNWTIDTPTPVELLD